MENIGLFLEYCVKLGCKQSDLFQTADLYDGCNIPQVSNDKKCTFSYIAHYNIIGY